MMRILEACSPEVEAEDADSDAALLRHQNAIIGLTNHHFLL
jgi:hypothetical protein